MNEAFAAQYLAVEKELGLDRAKTNTNGGAIGKTSQSPLISPLLICTRTSHIQLWGILWERLGLESQVTWFMSYVGQANAGQSVQHALEVARVLQYCWRRWTE